MALYEFTGVKNPHTDWTTEIVLEKNEDGSVSKSVTIGEAVELSQEKAEQLGRSGFVFTKTSKSEVEKKQAERENERGIGAVASDTAGAAPIFGDESDEPNQADDSDLVAGTDQQ